MAALRVLILLVAAAALAAGTRLDPGAPAADPDAFSLELNYWGTPMLSWRIGSDGKGEYRTVDRPDRQIFQNYDIATRRFDAGADGFRQVRAIMDEVARLSPADLPCDQRTTDMPYGQAHWHRGAATANLTFDFGCQDRMAQQIIERLGQATSAAWSLASSQPVAGVEHVRGGGQP